MAKQGKNGSGLLRSKVGVGMSGHDNLFNVTPINTRIFWGKRMVTG